jgi:glycosyltransferase involved in cell wall biosynthesis
MRICFVFDSLYPFTVGGAERWYRNLADAVAERGHDVTFLTLRQWERGERPDVPGFDVIAVGPRLPLHTKGRRRISSQLAFGAGVFWHLLRRGRRYDVVHTPALHFSLLAVVCARPFARFRLVVDWFEVWTRDYWVGYLGPVAGRIGWRAQRWCARVSHHALCYSSLHERRLRADGFRGRSTLIEGLYAGEALPPIDAEPAIVFAGRHIPEKRVTAIVPAFARAREQAPELRCEIFGDGPERPEVVRQIEESGLDGAVAAPGFVDDDRLSAALRRALCLVLPSQREGYGLVVVEAAAVGTPSVVVAAPDNAATELVSDGENGVVAPSASAEDLAAAFLRVRAAGRALRESTATWFERNRDRLSLTSSLERVLAVYAGDD